MARPGLRLLLKRRLWLFGKWPRELKAASNFPRPSLFPSLRDQLAEHEGEKGPERASKNWLVCQAHFRVAQSI